jgi:hypothetical protein
MNTEYNGWRNIETWRVQLHLSNDEDTAERVKEMAMIYGNGFDGLFSEKPERFVDWLREYVEDRAGVTDTGGSTFEMLARDTVHAALQRVDWDDIAAVWTPKREGAAVAAEPATDTVDPHAADYSHIERMARLLPAWFCKRMAGDNWYFGLVLTTGHMLNIRAIDNVTQAADGSLWLDVEMASFEDNAFEELATKRGWPPFLPAPTNRNTCSVAVAQIVCAVELADT